MALFPKLSTGAVAQYPLTRTLEQRTRVIQYIDGTEQRISRRRRAIGRWVIRLERLGEQEADAVLGFFAQHRGRADHFDFEDPYSGAMVANCRFEQDDLTVEFTRTGGARTTLTIRSGD